MIPADVAGRWLSPWRTRLSRAVWPRRWDVLGGGMWVCLPRHGACRGPGRFADPLAAAASLAAGAAARRKNLPVPPARPVANAAVLPSVGSAVG